MKMFIKNETENKQAPTKHKQSLMAKPTTE